MKKTEKLLIALFSSTLLAGVLSGCGTKQVYERPALPPQVQGTEEEEWEWDEDNGEWFHSGGHLYWYNGSAHSKSILGSGIKSSAALRSSFFSTKGSPSGRSSGFGSSSHGGFGG